MKILCFLNFILSIIAVYLKIITGSLHGYIGKLYHYQNIQTDLLQKTSSLMDAYNIFSIVIAIFSLIMAIAIIKTGSINKVLSKINLLIAIVACCVTIVVVF